MKCRPVIALLLGALLGSCLSAQNRPSQNQPEALPAGEEPIRVQIDLVNILFSVYSKQAGNIGNLTQDRFKIYEEGKEQKIKYFTHETDLPLTLGLLIDVSRSQENLIGIEQNAASQFFEEVIRPKDLAFVISFGADAELLQDYTSSHKLLQKALHGLKVNSDVGGIMPSGPVPTISNPRGTILYDAVYLAADQQLRGQVGRKALVLITDGDDQGSRYRIDQAIEAAQKADAILYSIYYVDRQFYAQAGYGMSFGGGGESYLRKMSEETGGRVFKVDSKHTLHDVFVELQNELRSQYAIAYQPTNPEKDGKFRRIEIKTDNKEYKVRARKGYYAIPGER